MRRASRVAKLACCKEVRPENAARRFEEPAAILGKRDVAAVLGTIAKGRILELGAGGLRNALHLQTRGFRVLVVEVPEIEHKFPAEYAAFRKRGGDVLFQLPSRGVTFDLAVATFVIETVCDPNEREFLLRGILRRLKPSGALVISVRGPGDLVTAHAKGKRCSDGFITPNRTFARSFTRPELLALLTSVGFRRVQFLHKAGTEAPELLHAIAYRS